MKDYDILKKKYGENFAKFCRANFSTLMETEGLLAEIMQKRFYPNRELYNDIISNNLTDDFIGFIYNQVKTNTDILVPTSLSPQELFDMAGYDLYKCETQEDIDCFKKYYHQNEVICTFRDPDRIRYNTIFFAVKKDVDNIKRENFKEPQRQDEYGTSVISLQFTKGEYSYISIKNRYNHSVVNPDATFSNNLENIYPGLTKSFEDHYNIKLQNRRVENLYLLNYTQDADGKYYKYNLELDNSYFCADNVVVHKTIVGVENDEFVRTFIATKYDKNRYELIENFLLDKQQKTITPLVALHNGFVNTIGKIEKIDVVNLPNNERLITITNDNRQQTLLTVNNKNCIIKYENNHVTKIDDDFLRTSLYLKEFKADKLQTVGNDFLKKNKTLEVFYAPNLCSVGNSFLENNKKIKSISFPNLEDVGDNFLAYNRIEELFLPKLNFTGNYFCYEGVALKKLEIPNVLSIGNSCLSQAVNLPELNLPNVINIGNHFMSNNRTLKQFIAPQLEEVGSQCLMYNNSLEYFCCNNLKHAGHGLLGCNCLLKVWNTPQLISVGRCCLQKHNDVNIEFNAPKLKQILVYSFDNNPKIKNIIYSKDETL